MVPVDEQYLDTFDWRLYTTGLVLRQKGTRFILASHSGMPVLEASGPRKFRYMSECFRRFFPIHGDGPVGDCDARGVISLLSARFNGTANGSATQGIGGDFELPGREFFAQASPV